MEYIDLRKVGREGLKEIRRQVVRLKELGKTGKEIEELTGVRQNRASEIWTAYQREGSASLERKKIRAKARDSYGTNPERARECPEGNCGESAGRIRNHRQAVDIGTDAGIYPEGIPQNHQRADAIRLHEALGHELPAPSEACAETEPSGHLKVEKRGISRCYEACERRKTPSSIGQMRLG